MIELFLITMILVGHMMQATHPPPSDAIGTWRHLQAHLQAAQALEPPSTILTLLSKAIRGWTYCLCPPTSRNIAIIPNVIVTKK